MTARRPNLLEAVTIRTHIDHNKLRASSVHDTQNLIIVGVKRANNFASQGPMQSKTNADAKTVFFLRTVTSDQEVKVDLWR